MAWHAFYKGDFFSSTFEEQTKEDARVFYFTFRRKRNKHAQFNKHMYKAKVSDIQLKDLKKCLLTKKKRNNCFVGTCTPSMSL